MSPRCVCAALRVALRARVAQRVAPRCSSVGCGGGRHTRFRMSVRVFTRVDVCAQLSLGETAFACIPACLWVPVSTCVQALCVSVCSRVYMDQYACEYIEGWGFLGAETHSSPPGPRLRPPGGIRGESREQKCPHPSTSAGLCVSVLGWGMGAGAGGRIRDPDGSQRSPAGRHCPAPPPPGSEILGNDLESSSVSSSYPCLLYRKRGRTRFRLVATSAPCLVAPSAPVWAAGA